jgi:hypothetical protein
MHLGVKAGDKLLIVPRRDMAILLRRPKKYSQAITGIGKGLYAPDYLARERRCW